MTKKKKKINYSKKSIGVLLFSLGAIFVFFSLPKGSINRSIKKINFFSKSIISSQNSTTTIEEIKKEDPNENISGLDLLGRSKVSFLGGSEGRAKNIALGLAKINDTVVEPGKEFSFKDALGTTTLDMGYSIERVFLNGEVKKEIGGGLCQVSTTLFRSALSAGLPVTERANHSFTVSYYDVGLDATYSDPGPDLKFKNDTMNPIVIKGRVEDSSAVFEIYGKKDGRIASTTDAEITNLVDILPTKYVYVEKLEEGQSKCANSPQIGYTATVKYGVMYADGEYKEKDFVSRYKPLQRICYIVGDEIKDFDVSKILGKQN